MRGTKIVARDKHGGKESESAKEIMKVTSLNCIYWISLSSLSGDLKKRWQRLVSGTLRPDFTVFFFFFFFKVKQWDPAILIFSSFGRYNNHEKVVNAFGFRRTASSSSSMQCWSESSNSDSSKKMINGHNGSRDWWPSENDHLKKSALLQVWSQLLRACGWSQ